MNNTPLSGLANYDDSALSLLAEQLGQALRQRRSTLCTAESCTGGWVAKLITDIPGCSDWFECGIVAYSYKAKQSLLGVRADTLSEFGAVSRETVLEMVSGALLSSGASIAVAITGIAGPGGVTPGKPVGMVWIGWQQQGGEPRAEVFHFQGDRQAVRRQSVLKALQGLLAVLGA